MDFFERKRKEIGKVLNDVQKQAVTNTDGALLLLASPGSGKTTTMIMRIGYLIEEKGADPSRIMAVTFSNASARDMKDRFEKFFPNLSAGIVHFSTIHSFAFEVVRKYFAKNKVKYKLIEGDVDSVNELGIPLHKKMILRRIFQEVVGEQITDDQMDSLQTFVSFVKNKMLTTAQELLKVKTDLPSASDIYFAYEAYKQSQDELLVDFDDMLTICLQAFNEDAELLRHYQQRYDYVMTDESQDTSLVQHFIIEKLVKLHGNLCVVADDDQSIYGFRSAEPQVLLDFKKYYPNATILFMEQNYRSTKQIVNTANRFIKRNTKRYPKNMFTENDDGNPVKIVDTSNYKLQIKYVVQRIKESQSLADVAVLYRNNWSSISLINELDYEDVPFYIKDSDNKFFSHWVVEDVLNFMRMSYSDKRPELLERIHTKFNGYITRYQVQYLKGLNNGESVFDNLIERGDLQIYQIKQLKLCKTIFKQMNSLNPKSAIKVIRDKLGYEKALLKLCERFGFNKETLLNVLNTLEDIAERLNTLEEFAKRLTYLKDKMVQAKGNRYKEAVTLSTLHSSKGLEFDTVYMIDLIDGVMPTNDAIKDYKDGKVDELEESARLFYVGITRAMRHLELLVYRQKDGAKVTESIFVKDIRKIISPSKAIQDDAKSKKTAKEIKANPNALKSAETLAVGDSIRHAVFGVGVIEKLDQQIIGLRFEGIGLKQLALSVCLERGLLEPYKATSA